MSVLVSQVDRESIQYSQYTVLSVRVLEYLYTPYHQDWTPTISFLISYSVTQRVRVTRRVGWHGVY